MSYYSLSSDVNFDHSCKKGLSPHYISGKSATITSVTITKVTKETKRSHFCFNIFPLSGRFQPLEFFHPSFDLENPPPSFSDLDKGQN